MENQEIRIAPIHLKWSEWNNWNDLIMDGRSGGINIPNGIPGVYEARLKGQPERLAIGKASNLRMRVRQGLVKGKTPHSSGKQIRANENVNDIEIRWAETDRPCAVEEELHKQYLIRFNKWPKYTEHT